MTIATIDRTTPTPRPDAWPCGWQRWHELVFLHWPVPAEVLRPLVPPTMELDLHGGVGYVGLVPFQMQRVVPWRWWPKTMGFRFLETNVRTYVIDSAGNRAVWFLSLDAERLPVVAFARWAIGFPYVWSSMMVERVGRRWSYTTTARRWPRRPAATTRLVIDVGSVVEPTACDVFLTARWGTVARWGGTLRHHPVDHPPWVLHEATVVELDDGAVAAAGLGAPVGEPLVRFAQPLDARFGWPVRV
mgnify:CR=1 FL=1